MTRLAVLLLMILTPSLAEATEDRPVEGQPAGLTIADLPLIEVPATGDAGDTLAVLVSGDGGWAGIDRELAAALSARGVSVVGLNSLKYFWKKRAPDDAAADLSRIVRHYMAAWHKKRVVLIGYSFGADVLPFLVNRLPDDLRKQISLIALLGLSKTASFEFHVTGWLGNRSKNALPTLPEVERLEGLDILCVHGTKETGSLCPKLPDRLADRLLLKGDHHFGGDYTPIAEAILRQLK